MKSNLRKALALLLTLIMVMTSLPTSALAEMFAEASQSIQPCAGAKLRSVIKPDDEDVYVTFTFKTKERGRHPRSSTARMARDLKEPAPRRPFPKESASTAGMWARRSWTSARSISPPTPAK